MRLALVSSQPIFVIPAPISVTTAKAGVTIIMSRW